MFRRSVLAASLVFVSVSCAGSDTGSSTPSPGPSSAPPAATDGSPPATAVADDPTAPVAELSVAALLASAPEPSEIDPTAETACARLGYSCSPLGADDADLDRMVEVLESVDAAMAGSGDAREQMRLALLAVLDVEGVGHVEADLDHATMIAFTVDGGPRVAAFTDAARLQESEEIAPVDDSFVPQPGSVEVDPTASTEVKGRVSPVGFARSSQPLVRRYDPAGGPGNDDRSAAVFNPYGWSSAGDVAAIFRAEEQYGTVDVFTGADVTPVTVGAAAGYDAVHIITHGGGSCPSWTDDRSDCSSAFIGGIVDADTVRAQQAASDTSPDVDFFLCTSGGELRFCFNSGGFPSNPEGIVYFGSCGSDFGFNTTGAGASVGWSGTTQQRVAERTATKFWELMVTDGVEFELAKEIVQGGGWDSHVATYWASTGVNALTSSVFSGRNLRARDVIEMRIDGEEARGQVVDVNGLPEDANAELAPIDDQRITFDVEGVRTGSEDGVTIELRGDGEEWTSDLTVGSDGALVSEEDGYGTWRVTVDPEAFEIPDLSWSDLSAGNAPIEVEARAFEDAAEYTADRGTVRLATDVNFTGEIPIFTELERGLPDGGVLTGNDLRVTIDTGTGELTGSLFVELIASGFGIGDWRLELVGTYDSATGAVEGTVDSASQGAIGGASTSNRSDGTFVGAANLQAETIQIQLGIGGQAQTYIGTVVR